jgi:hypothetical protein
MAMLQPVAEQSSSRWAHWFGRFEGWLERVVDRCNPILVKECRQALKSRQFTITFALVLVLCWIWSIYGVMTIGPGVQFSTGMAGIRMFAGYFVILALPLLVVVPFFAFRSLADERDDHTFELLSITVLGPRQIIAGKLGSAMVQMLVYLSAIMPCLAFTYLLRGIEAPTILVVLFYMFFASLALSMIAILAATLAQERHWQTLWSAVIVIGLAGLFFLIVMSGVQTLGRERISFEDPAFWQVNTVIALAYLSYFALAFLAAAARLTFPSENRSTPLRVVMLAQQLILTFCAFWLATTALKNSSRALVSIDVSAAAASFMLACIHWYFMGMIMNGERPQLSNRAKRRLPQSFLGRAMLTWFNPGPGTGYVFAVLNLAAVTAMVLALIAFAESNPNWISGPSSGFGGTPPAMIREATYICILGSGYVVFYLGFGRLVIALLRRVAAVGMFLAVLIQILIFLIGTFAPPVIDEVTGNRFNEFRCWHVASIGSTMSDLNRQLMAGGSIVVVAVVFFGALSIFLLNLPGIMAELRQVRTESPQRVIEEEEALRPKPIAVPVNPFE